MFKFHIFYLLFVTDIVLSSPDYLFNYEARGWLKMHMVPATWEEAFLRCHYEGAVLASPLNKPLVNALVSVISTNQLLTRRIHLGTHSLFSSGYFTSVEGVPLSDMEIKWDEAGNEQCLAMSYNGYHYRMSTASCKDPRPFICYKRFRNETINACGTFDNDYHYNKYTGSCYKLHEEKTTWHTAYKICAAEGGYLLILNDKEEARTIREMYPGYSHNPDVYDKFPVGLYTWTKDRIWTTTHGERMEDVFHEWHPGQPDNFGGAQYLGSFIRRTGTLDDIKDDYRTSFVCEKSPKVVRFDNYDLSIDVIDDL